MQYSGNPDADLVSPQLLCTSETHPIRVDFLPPGVLPQPGKLGLTIAPGKYHPGMQFNWARDLEPDLARLRQHYQTDLLVSLIEAEEMTTLQIPNLLAAVAATGMRSRWFPIPDFGTPASLPGLICLVEEILAALGLGQTVVLHCRGGLGRSGLVAAACLVSQGYTCDRAFALVRAARPGSVETLAQEAYVQQFQTAWANRDRALQ